jgi:hypothetical protein
VRSPPAGSELKTLLQFVLYGDPLRTWTPAEPAPKAGATEGAPGAETDLRDRLAEYARWNEQAVPERKAARANRAAWNEVARFTTAAARGAAKTPPAKGAGPAERQVLRRAASVEDAPGAELAYFRELVSYPDAKVFEARSTGGRALSSTEEELAGAAPWWRHAGAVPAGRSAPQVVLKGKATRGEPMAARPKRAGTRRPERGSDAPNGKPRRAGKPTERGAT